MRRLIWWTLAVSVLTGGLVAQALPASADSGRKVDIGQPTVWIDASDSGGGIGTLPIGPATTSIEVLLPTDAAAFSIRNVRYRVDVGNLDVASGTLPRLTERVTIPIALPANTDPSTLDGRYGSLSINSPVSQDKLERYFPDRNAIQAFVSLRWDAAAPAGPVVADLSTPGRGIRVSYSFHDKVNIPIPVRRGQQLTFTSTQEGFFTKGPWSVAYPGRLEARYGWKPLCGRTGVRGCGGGVETTVIPVRVSPDGKKATVTFPATLTPPAKHRSTEIVELNWVPRKWFIDSNVNPDVPGTYEVVREVALR